MNQPWMYVVLLGLVFLAAGYMMPKRSDHLQEGAHPQLLKEMEESMEGFLAEVDEGNSRLLEAMARMKQEHDQELKRLQERMDASEKHSRDQDQELRRVTMQQLEATIASLPKQGQAASLAEAKLQFDSAANPATLEPQIAEVQQENTGTGLKSRYYELFQLHESGRSVEQIARQLNMNKGEVNLIIQLAKQEGRQGEQIQTIP